MSDYVERENYTEHDWYSEARGLESAGDLEGALAAFDESIKINPKYEKSWYYKAELLYKMGRMEEALECAKKVMEIKPSWKKHFEKNMPDLKIED